MRTCSQGPLRWGVRETGVGKGRSRLQCRPNRVLSWFLQGAQSRHGPSELSWPKGTDNNQSLDWLQLCNGQSLRADWLKREHDLGTAVLGKPQRRTQLRAVKLESFQPLGEGVGQSW